MLKTIHQYRVAHANLFGPIRNALSSTVKRYIYRSPRITHLLCVGGPTAVGRFIVAVVVDAIKLMLRGRAFAHIRQERCKVIPTFANRNTTSAVVSELFEMGIQASAPQPAPRLIFRALGATRRESVLSPIFRLKATARPSIASADSTGSRRNNRTTIAQTSPFRIVAAFNYFLHNKAVKPFSNIFGYTQITSHVHSLSVNVLTRALGQLQLSQGSFILAQGLT